MGGDAAPSPLTLADVWHALQTERHFRYEFWLDALLHILGRAFMRHLSRLLVVLVFVLLVAIGFFGFYTALPAVAKDKFTVWFAFNVIWGVFLLYGRHHPYSFFHPYSLSIHKYINPFVHQLTNVLPCCSYPPSFLGQAFSSTTSWRWRRTQHRRPRTRTLADPAPPPPIVRWLAR